MPRRSLIFLAFGLAFAGLCALVGYFYERPMLLRIAVARDSEDHALLFAIAHEFTQARAPFKLRIAPVDNSEASAKALDSGDVDMAIVRTDLALPTNGQTIVVLHHSAVLLASDRDGPSSAPELRGKKIGVIRSPHAGSGNIELLHKILQQYAISANAVQTIPLTRAEAPQALRDRRIDAMMIVSQLASNALADLVTLAGAGDRGLKFIPILEAPAMARRNPLYQSMETPRAMFSGDPPQPENAFNTLGVTVALTARATMSDAAAADFLRMLFSLRPRIARLSALANQIEAPSTSADAPLPVHPGARAYFDNDEQSFMDRYSDYLYIGAMLFSFVGTAIAAMMGRRAPAAQTRVNSAIGQSFALMEALRLAQSFEELKFLEAECDAILKTCFLENRQKESDPWRLVAMLILMERARAVAADRFRDLTDKERYPLAEFRPGATND